ncbi:MAG: hypothetical protein ACREQ9_22445 [Candidatus Binatia bacterium]
MTQIDGIDIAGLERQVRGLRRLVVILCLALAWPLLLGAESKDEKSADVEKLVVRDAKGAVRLELGTQPDGSAMLRILDAQGDTAVSLRGGPGGPILELADGHGGSAWLSSSPTGASLSLSKNGGEIELATAASGYPKGRMQNKDGKAIWNVPD